MWRRVELAIDMDAGIQYSTCFEWLLKTNYASTGDNRMVVLLPVYLPSYAASNEAISAGKEEFRPHLPFPLPPFLASIRTRKKSDEVKARTKQAFREV